MTKSVKVKIMIIVICLLLSALIMSYRYFTDFKQTQIDKQEEESVSWDSPINQFEFADLQAPSLDEDTPETAKGVSKIDINKKAILQIHYSTQPFINPTNAKEIADKIASYGKDPVIQNFIKDMNKALNKEEQNFESLPTIDELQKQMNSTQTQKILLQYSKDPTFKQAVQKALQDPVFASGFISYIQNRQEQQRSDK